MELSVVQAVHPSRLTKPSSINQLSIKWLAMQCHQPGRLLTTHQDLGNNGRVLQSTLQAKGSNLLNQLVEGLVHGGQHGALKLRAEQVSQVSKLQGGKAMVDRY